MKKAWLSIFWRFKNLYKTTNHHNITTTLPQHLKIFNFLRLLF
jgi:hypothetical protein